jgi:hypothetical protein
MPAVIGTNTAKDWFTLINKDKGIVGNLSFKKI